MDEEIFLCFICEKYKLVSEREYVKLEEDLRMKKICKTCVDKIKTSGLSKQEAKEPKHEK